MSDPKPYRPSESMAWSLLHALGCGRLRGDVRSTSMDAMRKHKLLVGTRWGPVQVTDTGITALVLHFGYDRVAATMNRVHGLALMEHRSRDGVKV